MKQENTLEAIRRQVNLTLLDTRDDLKLVKLVCTAKSLLITWQHILIWFHNITEDHECLELWWNLSFIDSFDVT